MPHQFHQVGASLRFPARWACGICQGRRQTVCGLEWTQWSILLGTCIWVVFRAPGHYTWRTIRDSRATGPCESLQPLFDQTAMVPGHPSWAGQPRIHLGRFQRVCGANGLLIRAVARPAGLHCFSCLHSFLSKVRKSGLHSFLSRVRNSQLQPNLPGNPI